MRVVAPTHRLRQDGTLVTAMRFTGENAIEIIRALGLSHGLITDGPHKGQLPVTDRFGGKLHAAPGDWVARSPELGCFTASGEFFDAAYEHVTEALPARVRSRLRPTAGRRLRRRLGRDQERRVMDAALVIEQARREALAVDGITAQGGLTAARLTEYPTVRAGDAYVEHVLEALAAEVEDARHDDDPAGRIADRIADLLNEARGR